MSITPTKLEIARDLLKDSILKKDKKIQSLIHKAQERINYKTIKSRLNLPSTANSAVDGYGILHHTYINNPKTEFEVIGVAKAGHPFKKNILPHQAIEIYGYCGDPSNASSSYARAYPGSRCPHF